MGAPAKVLRQLDAAVAADAAGSGPFVDITGAGGGFAALALAHIRSVTQRPLVIVVPDGDAGRALCDGLSFYDGGEDGPNRTVHYRALDHSPFLGMSPSRTHVMERTAALFHAVHQPKSLTAIVVEAGALLDRLPPLETLRDVRWDLKAGAVLDRDAFAAHLVAAGYHSVENVEDPGTFALRGGIIDVFVPHRENPLRIDLWGDEIDTLKWFDPDTQRSLPDVVKGTVVVPPSRTIVLADGPAGRRVRDRFFDLADELSVPSTRARAVTSDLEAGILGVGAEDLLPLFYDAPLATLTQALSRDDFTWVVVSPEHCAGVVETRWEQLQKSSEAARADGRLAVPAAGLFVPAIALNKTLRERARVRFQPFDVAPELTTNDDVVTLPFPADDNRDVRADIEAAVKRGDEHILAPLGARVRKWREKGLAVVVCAHTAGGAERLVGLLGHVGLTVNHHREPFSLAAVPDIASSSEDAAIFVGQPGVGFRSTAMGIVLLDETEILGRKTRRRGRRRFSAEDALASWRDLRDNDLVVHLNHGVGRYLGLVKTQVGNYAADFLVLQYAGADKLYVPVDHLHLVSKHVGAESSGSGRLDNLGGARWQATKRKVKKAVRDIADRLLKLYAEREAQVGFAFSPPGEYFATFEAAFPYEETPDQERAIGEVLEDMQRERPMDRLVCGDVGFGKTEVAMRGAFKAVLDGKQVAILVPTVVLAEQHRLTLERRFQRFPVKIGSYTRSKTGPEAKALRAGLVDGSIDIVVGTHKLLGKNVAFKNIGLLIVDEEHRFGVTHKERLKEYRASVDVLTLTATPIPRTLNLSMVGLRDLSLIQTPPAERLAVRTIVAQPNDEVIASAIERELERGGQVYFVHNRVEDLATKAELIRRLVPSARIVMGHGQMERGKLESVMLEFMRGDANVLVCTTVIESGIDIPNANTMLINRADRFGLAQLYQLRGRVGRSSERAFCYLLVPAPQNLSGDAAERIATLQRFSALGSGFSVASHDLDIRGSGDILGADQSGHINAVGYDGYLQLLKEAVAIVQAEQDDSEASLQPEPELKIGVEARIPSTWLPETTLRLRLYRDLAAAETIDAIYDVYQIAVDRFGEAPKPVDNLVEMMVIRVRAKWLGLALVAYSATQLTFGLAQGTKLTPEVLIAFVKRTKSTYRLSPTMQLIRPVPKEEWALGLNGLSNSLKELEMFVTPLQS